MCCKQRLWRHEKFAIVGEALLHEGFSDLLWYICKALYPMYYLLRLADIKIESIDNMKYFIIRSTDFDILEKWNSDSCLALKLNMS